MQPDPSPSAPQRVLDGLNEEQRRAAVAVRGPVAILAGAGTGKTTTITRRIAHQVLTGAFGPGEILAVTFTERAARELRARLAALGVVGVEARTFHAAALAQLARLWTAHTGEPMPDVLEAKAPMIAPLAGALPPPHRFLPRRELAGEIEWAKNRMVSPDGYLAEISESGHQAPVPPELMHRVFVGYERRKRSMGRLDFEDMLALAVRLFDEHPAAAERVRGTYRAFTVDEYQDVNPLQQALLERWLGGRDELCVVGDDYQTIYGFTGASPEHLLSFPRRYPHATVVRLERNYRSSPQVLAVANRLAPRLGGFAKTLRATRPPGPEPEARAVPDPVAEVDLVVDGVRRLRAQGVPFEEMAVLYRINARSEPFEEAFAASDVPYQVRDGAFLRRPAARSVLARLRRPGASAAPRPLAQVERAAAAVGYRPDAEPDSVEETTRQADLARLLALAREFESAHPGQDVPAFVAELARRFSTEEAGRGVNLLTYHRAKGLEFEAVFLPRLLDGELPFRSGRGRAPVDEERRLLYVGITRARRHLVMSWPRDQRWGRSPFLDDLVPGEERPRPPAAAVGRPAVATGGPLFDALKRWRLERSKADAVPAYVVFHDRTLAEIAERRPRSRTDLAAIPGVGPTKLERYAEQVLAVVGGAVEAGDAGSS